MVLIMVVGVANGIKRFRGMPTIPLGTCFMIFHSGLGGGMPLMMALMVDPYWSENQDTIVDATVVSTILMTYLCGCTGPFFLKLTGVPMNMPQVDGTLYVESTASATILLAVLKGLERILGSPKDGVEEAEDIAP